ncbi:hypothetical protein ACFWP5_07025 [Streptomyces sp. NPDC058469]|uniref:hypothetical protein n=1 Tax=Streptomyces sp. NPDC058469 TaxID=3346514 RepID=UPI00365E210C
MTATAAPSDLRARLAACLVFVIFGSTQGSWMARLLAEATSLRVALASLAVAGRASMA